MLQTSQGAGSGLTVDYSAMVHEMAEALQAITGYVGAARRMAIGTIEDSASTAARHSNLSTEIVVNSDRGVR